METNILEKIVSIPKEFSERSNVSFYTLIDESGYFKSPDLLQVEKIKKLLTEDSQKAKDWLNWSENKRTSSGWYFIKKNGKYFIGYYDPKKGNIDEVEYSDVEDACANFIKNEIEDVKK